MAYACPVCSSLAPDREHLAHHLAIVAMARGGEHEAWLDDHAAGWRDASPAAIAATAVEHAEAVEHELADENVGEHPDVAREHDAGHGGPAGPHDGGAGGERSSAASDEETAAVLAEAREITRRMLGDDEDGDPGDEEGGRDGGGGDRGDGDDAPGDGDDPRETDSDE